MAISPIFFLGNIDQENVFYVILERKNAFLGCKNKKFKKAKNKKICPKHNYIFASGYLLLSGTGCVNWVLGNMWSRIAL